MMSTNTFQSSVDFVLANTREPCILWIFHGGEPLLLGHQWLSDAMRYARRAGQARDVRVSFAIVTNGKLMDDTFCDLMAQERVAVSISMDGPPAIHDVLRGDGQESLVALRRMRNRGVDFRVLGVITGANWDHMEEVMDFFSAEGVRHTKFNACYRMGRGLELAVPRPDQVFEARRAMLERMCSAPHSFTEVNLIHQVLKYFQAHPPYCGAGCTTIQCGAGNGFLGIRHDGVIFGCGRADDLGDTWSLGNIQEPLDERVMTERLRTYHTSAQRGRCYTCPAARVCDFPCPAYLLSCSSNRALQCGISYQLLAYLDGLTQSQKNEMLNAMLTVHRSLPGAFRN